MPAAAAAPAPVVRHGFVIPSIRLTPPDSRPAKSPECPEQDLSNTTLYVPLRTEEIGWEEGGVIWGGKRPVYAYPTVNLVSGLRRWPSQQQQRLTSVFAVRRRR
jgi:hypothetical protein